MKQGWQIKKLGEICIKCSNIKWDVVEKGASFQYIDLTSVDRNDHIIHNPQTINKDNAPSRAKQIVRTGDVIFATTRPTLRRVSLIGEKHNNAICSTGFCVLRPNNEVLPQLVFYALQDDGFYQYIEPLQTGASYPAVTDGAVKNFQIRVPSISEQQRIVSLLDAEFAKIDALKANVEKNFQNAKDLFQAALKKELEPKEGWKETTLQEICTHIVDCPHTTPIKSPSKTEYPCVRTSELKNGEISWETMQYVEKSEYLKRVSRLVPQENDIVYGREGTFGDAILIPNYYHFCLGQRTMLFRPNQELVIPRFLLLYVISPYVYDQAKAKNTGCGVGHVNVRDIKEFSINLPQINDQQSIVVRLDTLNEKCKTLQANYEKTIALCDDLKKALLRKAFNGEI